MDRILLVVIVLLITGAVLSLLLSTFSKKKWVWFSPSLIGMIAFILINLKIQSETMEGHVELWYIIISFMVLAVMIGNILTNIYFILRKRKENKE